MSYCEIPSPMGDEQGLERPFSAPWEARGFALALALHEKGLFTWSEWAETLAGEIARARRLGEPDTGETYYRYWVAALERLLVAKGVTSGGMLSVLKDKWDEASRNTPHGEPVLLRP